MADDTISPLLTVYKVLFSERDHHGEQEREEPCQVEINSMLEDTDHKQKNISLKKFCIYNIINQIVLWHSELPLQTVQ